MTQRGAVDHSAALPAIDIHGDGDGDGAREQVGRPRRGKDPMSADPARGSRGANGRRHEAGTEDALAALQRVHLIRSWRRRGTTPGSHSTIPSDIHTDLHSAIPSDLRTGRVYEVVVGRGTVRVQNPDASGVLRLAHQLRRDRVTVVGTGYPMGYRTVRYPLSDGRFADRHDSRVDRYLDEFPYTVYLPGGDPSGCAAVSFAARTRTEALALAGLARVRGRCDRCHQLRPLHVDGWRPDPAIPCPGCGADAGTPVSLLCHACHQPITHATTTDRWPSRLAWHHTATGRPFCSTAERTTACPR